LPVEQARLQDELSRVTLQLGPLSIVTPSQGDPLHLWAARDALMLKALTLARAPRLSLWTHCVHVKGHGGAKASLQQLTAIEPK